MNENTSISKGKDKISRRETLPLLRGMFICPESIRRFKNVSGPGIIRDMFPKRDQQLVDYACE